MASMSLEVKKTKQKKHTQKSSRPVSLFAGRTGQLASISIEVFKKTLKNRPLGQSAST